MHMTQKNTVDKLGLMGALIALVVIGFAMPSVSYAVLSGDTFIPAWNTPIPNNPYAYGDHVVVSGSWVLPPDWVANIYVIQDSPVDGGGYVLPGGAQMSNLAGDTKYALSNKDNVATSSGVFSYDIGAQLSGNHNIYIQFWGGKQCAVNQAYNNQFGTNLAPTCPLSEENFRANLVYPLRNFTVGVPQFPVMNISPATDPALNFANVPFGTGPIQSFFITNTGGQTLTGTVSGVVAPFFCVSGCVYSRNPGDAPWKVDIKFFPLAANLSYDQQINFSCNGTTLACRKIIGVTGVTDELQPTQTRRMIGNSVANALPPMLSVNPASINYGNLNLGVPVPDRTITISNPGGGILTGTLALPSVEFSCVGSCDFSVPAGVNFPITIRFVPALAGDHSSDYSATIGSNGGNSSVPLISVVNDKPIANLLYGSIDFGSPNVGECADKLQQVQNSGAGLLNGAVFNIPIATPADKLAGFSCVQNCTYNNLPSSKAWAVYQTVTLRYCPSSDIPASTIATFTNTGNPPGSASVTLTGSGNIAPIGSLSSPALGFGGVLKDTTKSLSITIANLGLGRIKGAIGAMPAGFTCTAGCAYDLGAHLAGDDKKVITFTFAPTLVQAYGGSVNIPGIGILGITGTGIFPQFQMSYAGWPTTECLPPATTCLPPTPKSYDIGTTVYGGDISAQNKKFYLYIMNTGTGANLTYEFPDTAHFKCIAGFPVPKAVGACSGTLTPLGFPNYNEQLTFEFQPDGVNDYDETLVVKYDYGDGVSRRVRLHLQAHAISSPLLSVNPLGNIALGNVKIGASATATFAVKNIGTGALTGTVTIPPPSLAADPLAGLISRWTFNAADIDWTKHSVKDATGNGNTGYFAGPISAVGKFREAIGFNGKGGGVNIPSVTGLPTGNTPHTMAMWIKVNSYPSFRSWIALLGNEGAGAEHWLISSDGKTQFGVWGGSQAQPGATAPGTAFPLNTWTHVALTYDGFNIKSYKNGVLDQTLPASYNLQGLPLTLGTIHNADINVTNDFDGAIDEVRVYKRALSDAEVSQVYTGVFNQTADLVEDLNFNDPSVAWDQLRVYDNSSRANDGFLPHVPFQVSGKIGEAATFSGVSMDQITTTKTYNNPQDFSVASWVRTSSASGHNFVGFEKMRASPSTNYDRLLYVDLDGKVRFALFTGTQTTIPSTNAVTDGVWHHVIGTHSSAGGVMKMYVDGVLQGTVNGVTAENWGSPGYWKIGGYSNNAWPRGAGHGYFTGDIDDVRVYDHALSVGEVSDLYGSGVAVGAGAFTCIDCSFTNLLTNQTKNVTIKFTPATPIGYIAYPVFTSNGGNNGYPNPPYTSISGTGVQDPIISVSPVVISFPDTNQGQYVNRPVTIKNIGLGDLIGNITPFAPSGLNFFCVANCSFSLGPNEESIATFQFRPLNTGTFSQQISVNSNAVNGVQKVNVDGKGVFAPIIDLGGSDTNFGNVLLKKYKEKTFRVTNSGTSDLGSGAFIITDPKGEFTCVDPVDPVDGLCHYNLTANSSVSITIRFTPKVTGRDQATVSLSGVPLGRFFIEGTGIPPQVKFEER